MCLIRMLSRLSVEQQLLKTISVDYGIGLLPDVKIVTLQVKVW